MGQICQLKKLFSFKIHNMCSKQTMSGMCYKGLIVCGNFFPQANMTSSNWSKASAKRHVNDILQIRLTERSLCSIDIWTPCCKIVFLQKRGVMAQMAKQKTQDWEVLHSIPDRGKKKWKIFYLVSLWLLLNLWDLPLSIFLIAANTRSHSNTSWHMLKWIVKTVCWLPYQC